MLSFKHIKQYIIVLLIKAVQKFGSHQVRILGNHYRLSDRVFNPKYYYTSIFMAKNLHPAPGDTVLDMGTGSGIQAITAGRTASRVVAVDINPEAVRYARENIKNNGMDEKVSVVEGDLFSPLQNRNEFSLILFTPPYLEGSPKSDFDHALFDPDKKLVRRFFTEAGEYLQPEGSIQMLYSSIADHNEALAIATECGWDYSLVAQEETLSETFFIYRLQQGRKEVEN